jgi:RNA polymerase sigma-70 factor (ECF subfamily)
VIVAADEELIARLAAGDGQAAARALYRAYGGELYGFALRRLGDRGAAEELVQDVFTRVWRHAAEFDPARGTLRTWLYGIARNALVDAERRRAARPQLAAIEPGESADPDEPLEQALLRWQIGLALERLTPEHRQAIELLHLRGLSVRETARRLGVPEGTVKSRCYYALQALRLTLDELGVVA